MNKPQTDSLPQIDNEILVNQVIKVVNELRSKVIVGIIETKMSEKQNKLQELYRHLQESLKTVAELDEGLYNSLILNDLNLQICKAIRLIIKQTNMLSQQADTLQSFKQKVLNLILELEGEQFYSQVISKLAVSDQPFEKVILQEVNKLGVPKFNNFVKRVREIKSVYQFPIKLEDCSKVENLTNLPDNLRVENYIYKKESVLKHGIEMSADNSVQSKFFRLVLDTIAENCDEETLTKVVAIYKSPAKLGVDATNRFLLKGVWAICGNEVVRRLYLKVQEANLEGCWVIDNPFLVSILGNPECAPYVSPFKDDKTPIPNFQED